MKKLAVLLVAIIIVLAFALTGCANNEIFTEKSYSSGENEIEKIIVDVEDRELAISASDDNQIYIDYFDGEKEYLDITISENKELTIKLSYNKSWTDFFGSKASVEYRKIKLKVPENLLNEFTASTTNQNIIVNSFTLAEKINLKTNGGDITLEHVNANKSISLTAKNGNITGSIIGGMDDYSISCKIKKGDCNLPLLKKRGEKSFFADCNNGDINIEFIK